MLQYAVPLSEVNTEREKYMAPAFLLSLECIAANCRTEAQHSKSGIKGVGKATAVSQQQP